jgi:subtilisin family serine protease
MEVAYMKRPARHLAAALCALLGALTGVAEAAPRGNVAPLAPGTDLVLPTLDQGDAIPRELLVGFRRTAEGSERAAARRAAGVQVERALRIEGVQLVMVNRGQSTREAIARLESDPAVRYAEPNRLRRHSATDPDDPEFDQLWGLHNTGQTVNGATGLLDSDIDALEAWDISTGGDTLVAVVDEGVAYDHPDLAPNMWSNPGEIPDNGEDDDGNGYVDDIHGIDTVDLDSDPRDFGGHGTHVAGTIAAAGNNGIGIAGVSWEAEVMAVRALGPDGGTDAEIAEAFDYAGDMGAQVVNASLGGPGESQTLQQPITDHPNTLFVVAAGNGGEDGIGDDNDGAEPEFPCAYNNANLICVAATTQGDGLASFSNFGATTVDLGAPGTNVLSAAPDRGKVVFSDTFENDDFADRWTPFTDPEGGPEWSRDSGGAGGSGFSAGDSPGGDYANDAGAYMDLLVPLDLGDEHGCELSFDMKLEVRAGDQFVVYKSYDGVDFEAIGATRADLGRSTGGNFVPARLALEADGQDTVIISFGVESNGTDTADGASVDNVEVACIQPEEGEGDLAFSSGTSMATPHVSGAAALLFSHRPSLTVEQAKTILLTTGDALPSLGGGKTVSGRRLNLDAALRHSAAAPEPEPQTGPASDVTASGATLGGSVNPAGTATEFYFEYGATSGYGHQTPAQQASGSQPVAVSAHVSGLAASTTYHYRVVALRGGIAFPGDDRTFTTHATPDPGPGPGAAPPAPLAGTVPTGATAEPVDTLARIVNTAKVTCKRARRGLMCKVTAQGTGTVKLRLAKSGRTLARGSGQIGRTLRLSRRVKPGRYRLRVAFTDSASGRSQTITRSVRVR